MTGLITGGIIGILIGCAIVGMANFIEDALYLRRRNNRRY